MKSIHRWLFIGLPVLLTGCASIQTEPTSPSVGRLEKLGNHSFNITTSVAAAQRAFDRGLTLAYAFSHHAAEQEFRRAIEADPNCAMAWWGVALVNGPHINYPLVPPARSVTAWEAITKARALASQAGPLEQALIKALSVRYANPQPADRSPLDNAYAAAMRKLWQEHPTNADVGTLFVEAAMDVHPWDLWKDGKPQPWTPEVTENLERVLKLDPRHPGATHLYIHAIEASPQPAKALPAADRLRSLIPDASHLVHMPAHIYARVGQWDDAATANRQAMKADALYRVAYPRPGFYAMYMTHNAHFLTFVCMMQGRSTESIRLARQMVASVPKEFVTEYAGIADGFMIFVSEVLMRFGRWDEILAEPQPPAELPFARAMWHFTRATALTALGRMDKAREEKAAFEKATLAVPKDWTFGNNLASDILAIAVRVLEGEMAAKAGQFDAAIASLGDAVQLEDRLRYDEPPDWIQPVRHTLGAVLMRAGKNDEAEKVYRTDLEKWPENGWALRGLRDSLQRQGKFDAARGVDPRLKKAWASSDVNPPSTCYCQIVD